MSLDRFDMRRTSSYLHPLPVFADVCMSLPIRDNTYTLTLKYSTRIGGECTYARGFQCVLVLFPDVIRRTSVRRVYVCSYCHDLCTGMDMMEEYSVEFNQNLHPLERQRSGHEHMMQHRLSGDAGVHPLSSIIVHVYVGESVELLSVAAEYS